MFITRMALPRRTFLRGVGATLALPFLDAMVPARSLLAQTAAKPVRRLGFIYLPNGVAMNHTGTNYWKPETTGYDFEFSPILKPLEPFRDQMVVVSGTVQASAEAHGDGNGDHARATPTYLSGVHPKFTQGSDVRAGTTIDQIAAAEWGQETVVPSLELATDHNFLVGNCQGGYSCVYLNTLSWRTPTVPLPTESNPRMLFERLFGEGGTSAQQSVRRRRDASLLDAVMEDMQRLERRLGPGDKARATEYFDSVREIERRIQAAEKHHATEGPSGPDLEQPPAGVPDTFGEHVTLMFDMQLAAFQADITRVFTFMLGREVSSRTFPEIGLPEAHHPMSHHRDDPEAMQKYAKLNTFQTQLFAHFVEKMQATPDGDGTLLDHSMMLYGSGLANGNIHSHYDIPLSVVGGGIKGGSHIAASSDTPMTNLLVTMVQKSGIKVDRFGDSTGQLDIEPTSSF